jgi:hypothetical protein
MWLPSRLERSTLGDLLGSLHRGRATGRLELVEVDGAAAGARRTIHLLVGEVVRVDGSGRRLGERIAGSVADQVAIERALAARDLEDARLAGEVLLTEGLADADAIRAALEAQARERLEGLFTLRRAQIRFRVAAGPAPAAPRITLGPDAFLHGRPRLTPRLAPSAPAAPDARALLGLDPRDANDPDAIRRAFRRRAAALHPDRARDGTSRRVLERAFAQLGDAYRRALEEARVSAA